MAPALCDPFSAPRVGPGTARAGDMAQPGKVRCDPGTSAAPVERLSGAASCLRREPTQERAGPGVGERRLRAAPGES